MKRHLSRAAVLFASFVLVAGLASLSAASLSGSWDIDGDVMGHPVKFPVTLDQQGSTLAGKATIEGNAVTFTGTAEEKNVTWTMTIGEYELVFTGVVETDDEIKGTIAVSGAEGVFTAKRQTQ